MRMEIDDRNVTIAALRWLPPVHPLLGRFPLGEAIVAAGPKPGGDTVLLVAVAFQIFQWNLVPKGSAGGISG